MSNIWLRELKKYILTSYLKDCITWLEINNKSFISWRKFMLKEIYFDCRKCYTTYFGVQYMDAFVRWLNNILGF